MSNDPEKIEPAPLILAVETATRAGGVAVARGETVLAALAGDTAVSHSTNLLELIGVVLGQAQLRLGDIDLFAVAVGPGSFTGLRIGLATAKAFAVHLDRKMIGVPTLAAVAHASGAAGAVLSLLPAGRGEVFAQSFRVDEGGVTALDEAQHLAPSAVEKKYSQIRGLRWAGDGVAILEKFGVYPGNDATAGTVDRHPRVMLLAPSVAALAYRAFVAGNSVTPEELRAVYVRASDAEINERWQQQKLQQQAHS